jgi:hypothetical protein
VYDALLPWLLGREGSPERYTWAFNQAIEATKLATAKVNMSQSRRAVPALRQ